MEDHKDDKPDSLKGTKYSSSKISLWPLFILGAVFLFALADGIYEKDWFQKAFIPRRYWETQIHNIEEQISFLRDMQQIDQTSMLLSGNIPNEPFIVNGKIDTIATSHLADNLYDTYQIPLKNNTEIDSIYLAMINNISISKQEKDEIAKSYHNIKYFDELIAEQVARIDSIRTNILVKY